METIDFLGSLDEDFNIAGIKKLIDKYIHARIIESEEAERVAFLVAGKGGQIPWVPHLWM